MNNTNLIEYVHKNYNEGTFIDIGSNIGTYSIPFSKVADIVYSFEPIRNLCFKQTNNIILNKSFNVTVINCALGDINLEQYIEYAKGSTSNILVVKLDDFVINNIKIIKISEDGYELNILKGATRTIIRNKPDLFIKCVGNGRFVRITKFLQKLGCKYTGLSFDNSSIYLFKVEQ